MKTTMLLILLGSSLHLMAMEYQVETTEKQATFIEFLTKQTDIAKQTEIKRRREFKDPEIKKMFSNSRIMASEYADWLEKDHKVYNHTKTILDHIRFDHKWGSKYLQIAPSNYTIKRFYIIPPYGNITWTIERDEKLIEQINTLFSQETIQKQIQVKTSRKQLEDNPDNVGLYTAWFDLTPWQDFFFELMPWHHKHPNYYALSLIVPACIATWYYTKKMYQK